MSWVIAVLLLGLLLVTAEALAVMVDWVRELLHGGGRD